MNPWNLFTPDIFWAIVSAQYFPFRAYEVAATIELKREELSHWLSHDCGILSDMLLQSESNNYRYQLNIKSLKKKFITQDFERIFPTEVVESVR